MIGTLGIAGPHPPKSRRKDDHRQKKENSGHFQPQNSAHPAKRPQKTAYAPRHACRRPSRDLPTCSSAHTCAGHRLRRGGCRGALCAGGHALAGNPCTNPQPGAQHSSNRLRSHFDMMVAAAVSDPHFSRFSCASLLLQNRTGSKVDKTHDAPRATSRAGRPWRYPLTASLRELIQQLGEAIHEAVIESEQIAGVVQDIREHGFDVLLMLEATIGLNEVSSKDTEASDEEGEDSGVEAPFTKNDLSFLRSLRIAVEGDEGESHDKPDE